MSRCWLMVVLCAWLGWAEGAIRADSKVAAGADFVRGVNYAHIHRRGHGYGSDVSRSEMANLRDLGVNWVALTPFGYQQTATDSELSLAHDRSMTDADLQAEMRSAHSLGLKVLIKPHIWSRDFWQGQEWHGTIRQLTPESHASWWASYRRMILYYARLAQAGGAEAFCVGTELVSLTTAHPDEWRELIAEVRKLYSGPLTYAAHWETECFEISFWDALDAIGINAYFPLDAGPDADVDDLVAAWQPHRRRIAELQARYDLPIVFLEAGYRPVRGAYQQPWVDRGGEPDLDAQSRAYEAMFEAFKDAPWWRGVFIWKSFTDPTMADRRGDGSDFSFRHRPAEAVIRRWYLSAASR